MPVATSTLLIVFVTVGLFSLAGIIHSRHRITTIEDFITLRNSIGPSMTIATLVASGMGAWILFSPSEAGTFGGVTAIAGYSLGAAAPFLAFLYLGPRMRTIMPRGHSLTEYVWHRYGRVMYLFILTVILLYMFVFLSAELTGIALAVHLVSETSLGLTALLVGIATVAYTGYGGLRASVFTDGIQFLLIIPLLMIGLIVTVTSVGGIGNIIDGVQNRAPELLSLSNRTGLEFTIAVVIAVFSANLFHQGYWQRIYACRDDSTLRRACIVSIVLVVPIVFVAGLFGIIAKGTVEVATPSAALFTLIVDTLDTWVVMVMLVLAIALVMSSMDTILNGIASLFTTDLARFKPHIKDLPLLNSSRAVTVLLTIPAIFIASKGYSVLYMFFIADLVAAGAATPMFLGLYARRFGGTAAIASSVLGILVGLLYFPTSLAFERTVIPFGLQASLMWSFLATFLVSGVGAIALAVLASRVKFGEEYDFASLKDKVHLIGD